MDIATDIMSLVVIKKKVRPLRCHRCSYYWYYTGKNEYVVTCPHCRTKVSLSRKRSKIANSSEKGSGIVTRAEPDI